MSIAKPIEKSENIEHTTLNSGLRKKNKLCSSPDRRVPLLEGTELAGYLIGKVLGAGSFSVVYDATELETGRRVAIKEYYPKRFSERKSSGLISPLEGRKRISFRTGFRLFYGEAKALEKVSHPNVLHIHKVFRANRTAYLVFFNEGGRDLKWFLTSLKKPLDRALVYQVFMPVLSALSCLHDVKTLHLDIKPANILLQPNGRSQLLDFGAAREMDVDGQVGKTQVVTHGFAPPEQYGKERNLGPWTDVYALAATIYFSIVGKMPCKSTGSTSALNIDITRYGRHYPSAMIEAINRALLHDTSERFANMDHFAAALLEGSEWFSLKDFETREMGFDRLTSLGEGCLHNTGELVAA